MSALQRQNHVAVEDYEKAMNLAIVENYFPLYLQEQREGGANDFHLRVAAAAYSNLSKTTRADMPMAKVVTEDSFRALSESGILHSFGYRDEDVATAEKFNSLRQAYLRTLEANQEAEQGVAPQSATRSESDSEVGDKPQPDSEERSR
ncbi:MAG: hypothetical protein ABJO26_15145 [Luteolibacter sp.]